MAETINLGTVTAYGAAVQGGYTGTYNDFKQHIADFANAADEIEEGLTSKANLINGKVPSSELPSYVDDVIEGYYKTDDGKFYEESTYETEIIGESGKIYVDLSTNFSYRWSGSIFVQIGGGSSSTPTLDINPSESTIADYPNGTLWLTSSNNKVNLFAKVNGIYTLQLENSLNKTALKFSSDSDFTLSAPKEWDGTLEYTVDNGNTWNTWDGSQLSGTDTQPIYLRGTGNSVISNGYQWTFTGKYCIGNIENLLDYQTVANGEHPVMGNNCYGYMFNGCTSLAQAPELPATTLADSCYNGMFQSCTSLTKAPELPATILAEYCYNYMFYNCTSLTTVPELPATILANNCYFSMFDGCTSLTTAPVLPATTLAEYCYQGMFQGCTSLTTAPELPATTLAEDCYHSMFQGCSALTTAPELPATILANNCYMYMFNSCSALIKAPQLSATTLANNCYAKMFYNCTSLTTLPKLPATTLTYYISCYNEMFGGCRSIKLSEIRTDEYQYAYRIPTTGDGQDLTNRALTDMFRYTGGTFTGTPIMNTTYYTTNQPV